MPSVHSITSRYSFDDTVARLQATFLAKGMSIFGIINHQAAAQESGLSMQPATVIVFGTPKAGTPLMVKDPEFALQLPLKVLVTEQNGQVKVVFNDTRALIQGSKINFFRCGKQLGQCGKTDCKNRNGISRSKIPKGRLKTRKRFSDGLLLPFDSLEQSTTLRIVAFLQRGEEPAQADGHQQINQRDSIQRFFVN